MAIKISGTTVINDSRGLENLGDGSQFIRKPTITSPTAAETDVDVTPTITGSAYDALFSNTRDYREFQIDLASGDFSSPVVSQQVNADSFTVSSALDGETEHKVRIRDVDTDGVASEFSDVVNFTTVDPFTVASLGDSVGGGFYMGTICAASTCYYLVVAPNATGCACCSWATSPASGECQNTACSFTDGFLNTYATFDNGTDFPAGFWTATRTIGGFSDWYLPAPDELTEFFNNGGATGNPLPAGEDFATESYWSSREHTSNLAGRVSPNGYGTTAKPTELSIRAVRRVPV